MCFGLFVRMIEEQFPAPMFAQEKSGKTLGEKEVSQVLEILTRFISVNMP